MSNESPNYRIASFISVEIVGTIQVPAPVTKAETMLVI